MTRPENENRKNIPYTKGGNPDPIPTSPTRVDTYLECPRRYLYRYIEHRPADHPPGPALAFGAAVHLALADGFRAILAGADAGQALAAASDRLVDAYDDDPALDLDTYADAADALVRTFDDDSQLASIYAGRTIASVEESIKIRAFARLADGRPINLATRLDLVVLGIAAGSDIWIIDHKTGRRPAATARTLQAAIYVLAHSHTQKGAMGRDRHYRFVLWHPLAGDRGELVVDMIDDELVERAGAKMVDVAEQIVGETRAGWAPVAGRRCRWCEWRRACPIGPEHSNDRRTT